MPTINVNQTNASQTAKGIVEEATQAELNAGTDTGGTGARLFAVPSKILSLLGSYIKSLAAIGAVPNANGATITGDILNLEPASVLFGGVVTTGTQSFAGSKTFTGEVTLNTMLTLAQNSSGVTGNNADIPSHASTNIRLTNGGLVSLSSINITGVLTGHQLWLHNDTGNSIIIVNNGAVAAGSAKILTTLGSNINLPNESSIILEFDSTDSAWRLVGNVGFASASYPGYLSAANWSTFNSKQDTLTTAIVGSLINGATAATPNDTDLVATAESSILKKITWTNVKAFLKTYFDTLYPTATSTTTFTNKRITPRVVSAASYTTDTGTSLDCDTTDLFAVTAQAGALKFNNPSGTPTNGQVMLLRIKDNGTARALTYDTQFRGVGCLLPPTTVVSKVLYMVIVWNAAESFWDMVNTPQQF